MTYTKKKTEISITTMEANAFIDLHCKDIYGHTQCTYTIFSADRDSLAFILIIYPPGPSLNVPRCIDLHENTLACSQVNCG